MSEELTKRVAAIHAGETFMTCKGCKHWSPQYGNRDKATIGWCVKASYTALDAPGGYMTRHTPVQMNGVVNGNVTITYDQSTAAMEYPVTTDLQCCSAWEQTP